MGASSHSLTRRGPRALKQGGVVETLCPGSSPRLWTPYRRASVNDCAPGLASSSPGNAGHAMNLPCDLE